MVKIKVVGPVAVEVVVVVSEDIVIDEERSDTDTAFVDDVVCGVS